MFPVVGPDALQPDALQRLHLLLLVCVREQDQDSLDEVLQAAEAALAGSLTIWLLDETALPDIKDRFLIDGTPTFLLLHRGVELERWLGKTDAPTLVAFLLQHAAALPAGST